MENPVIKKLRIKEDMELAIINAPAEYIQSLGKLPKGVKIDTSPKKLYDLVHLFVKNKAELAKMGPSAGKLLKPDAAFWISYPKKSSKMKTDLSRDEGWNTMKQMGFEGVSLIAIDEIWSAGRFKFIGDNVGDKRTAASERSGEDLKYIDLEKRTVKAPADLQSALTKNKAAQHLFESLAFSHKKEYVRWIIEAKREETRKERVSKTVAKLLEGKKNPTEK